MNICILVPIAAILLASATDRDLWQGPKQEVREPRTSGFCAQPQKFETITVTIGYILVPRAYDLFAQRWDRQALVSAITGCREFHDIR